jgi:hypothetical protein
MGYAVIVHWLTPWKAVIFMFLWNMQKSCSLGLKFFHDSLTSESFPVFRHFHFTRKIQQIKLLSSWPYSHLLGLGRFSSFLTLYRVGRTPWTWISPSQCLCLHTEQHKQNKRTQTSMPRVGFEPMTSTFGRPNTFRTLDLAGTLVGIKYRYRLKTAETRNF